MEFISDLGEQLAYLLMVGVTAFIFISIYSKFLTKDHKIAEQVLLKGNIPSIIEISAVCVAFIILASFSVKGDEASSFILDLEMTAINLLISLLFFVAARIVIVAGITMYFKDRIDKQGDVVRYNNEIFKQGNIAAALFSVSTTLVITFSVIEIDPLNTTGFPLTAAINAAGVLLIGILFILVHTLIVLGLKNNLLDEVFIDNNLGAAASLLGFIAGALYALHLFVQKLPDYMSILSTDLMVLKSILLCMVFFIPIKMAVIWLINLKGCRPHGVTYRQLLIQKDIASVGILDGLINFLIFFSWPMVALS